MCGKYLLLKGILSIKELLHSSLTNNKGAFRYLKIQLPFTLFFERSIYDSIDCSYSFTQSFRSSIDKVSKSVTNGKQKKRVCLKVDSFPFGSPLLSPCFLFTSDKNYTLIQSCFFLLNTIPLVTNPNSIVFNVSGSTISNDAYPP